MEVEIFALCDAATDQAGKLNILGAFDRIGIRKLPVVYPHCAIALRIRFDRIEEGSHRVRINVVNADGQPLTPGFDSQFTVRFPPDGQSVCANLVLQINSLKFETPGQYAIDLAIDGRHDKSLPLYILYVKPKEQKTDDESKGTPEPPS